MPAKCPQPHCGKTVEKGADGRYPEKCPHCGLLLRTRKSSSKTVTRSESAPPNKDGAPFSNDQATKTFKCPNPKCRKRIAVKPDRGIPSKCPHCSAPIAKRKPPSQGPAPKPKRTPPVEPAPTEERVVRSFTEASNDPFTASNETDVPFFPSVAEKEDPFGVTEAKRSSAVSAQRSRPAPSAPAGGLAVPTDGGALAAASRARLAKYHQPSIIRPWMIGGALFIGALVAGYFTFGKDLLDGYNPSTGVTLVPYQVSNRNYSISIPKQAWQLNEPMKKDWHSDLVFQVPADDAWIAVASSPVRTKIPTPGELADEVLDTWSSEMDNLKQLPGEETLVAQTFAARVIGIGKWNGGSEEIRREAYVLFNEGIAYRITFTAPASKFDDYGDQFKSTLSSFAYIGERPGWKAAMEDNFEAFPSRNFPYQVRLPIRKWEVSPELVTGSRLADLKLVDKTGNGNIVVTPRESASIEDLKSLYIRRQKDPRINKSAELRAEEDRLTIGSRPAARVDMLVEDIVGDRYFLLTTFLMAEKSVYQIEGRAPAAQEDSYRSIFVDAAERFEVLDSIADPPPTMIARSDPKAKVTKPESEPAPKPAVKSPTTKMEVKPPPTTVATSTTPGSTRPSLDDLGSPTPAATSSERPQVEPASTKSRPSLDNLGGSPASSRTSSRRSALDDLERPLVHEPDDGAKTPPSESSSDSGKPSDTPRPALDDLGKEMSGDDANAKKTKRRSLDDID